MALTTLGWQWPVETTPMPARKGRVRQCRLVLAVQSAGLAGALTRGHVKMFAAIAGPDVAALGPLRDVLLQHNCAEGSVSHQKAFVLQGMQ